MTGYLARVASRADVIGETGGQPRHVTVILAIIPIALRSGALTSANEGLRTDPTEPRVPTQRRHLR
mgnify:CR=1 FL=1|jgi:hypothetical protein